MWDGLFALGLRGPMGPLRAAIVPPPLGGKAPIVAWHSFFPASPVPGGHLTYMTLMSWYDSNVIGTRACVS